MSIKIIGGGLAALLVAGFLVARPSGDPGDAAHIAEFKSQCQRAAGAKTQDFCRCVVQGFEGELQSEDEYLLAAAIVRSIGQVLTTNRVFATSEKFSKDVLQAKFDRLSKEYHGRVSLGRKDDVLKAVVGGVRACEAELPKSRR